MRKLLALAAILTAIITIANFSSCNNNKDKSATAETSTADSSGKMIERGKYLAHHITMCMDCHSTRDTGRFSMPVVHGTEGGGSAFPFGKGEGIPGEVTPPNITPYALKDWTDEEIVRTITGGVNKKGDTLFPIMPYPHYSKLAKSDVLSIVAYIRSLKPIEGTVPPRKFFIPASMFGPLPPNTLEQNQIPDPADKVKYGEYLVNAAVCAACHTPMTDKGPDMSKMFGGGFTFDLPMMKVTVANITPDSATGIGAWTEEMFVSKFKNNSSDAVVNTRPGRMNTIMPWSEYGKMKDEDLRAIYAYLRTVKPISNKVEKYPK